MKTGWGISDRKKKLWNPEVHRMHFLMPINSLQPEPLRNLSLSHFVELINLSQDTTITGKNQESCITKYARKFSSPKMRPAPAEKEAANISHRSPPPPPLPSRPSSCDPQVQSCKWWPYSNSNDVGANTATILMILLCALICALAFNTAIRWFLRSDHDSSSDHLRELEEQRKPKKESDMASLVLATTELYSAGLKLGGAEADCAICLSEFEEGEGIRVLGRCNHGFHVHCVEKWLSSHSSCPTCRRSCLASSLSSPEAADCSARNGLDSNSSQSAEPERAPDNLSANQETPVVLLGIGRVLANDVDEQKRRLRSSGVSCLNYPSIALRESLMFLFPVSFSVKGIEFVPLLSLIMISLKSINANLNFYPQASLGRGTGGDSSPFFSYISLRNVVSTAERVPGRTMQHRVNTNKGSSP
ncbi:hypothetical protein OIU77_008675 [Salix suchowensis]|uniref:RING-type E3 ubiquitin transferase n=1 Tax=Salix suchowensis TaxID=1278906 RepID=A0ABQ9ACY6_9ROSI|nr:hypothetical protein OIU77_008675 [Salix suchowensis]